MLSGIKLEPRSSWTSYSGSDLEAATTDIVRGHTPGTPPVLIITNLLFEPTTKDLIFRVAANDARTALVAVDEDRALSDQDCERFSWVVRVGFGSPHHFLWQPANSVVVPLGTPDPYPDLHSTFDNRAVSQRAFAAAYAGRTQNLNRELAMAALEELGAPGKERCKVLLGRVVIHSLGNQQWGKLYGGGSFIIGGKSPGNQTEEASNEKRTSGGEVLALDPAAHAALLADAAMTASPAGNAHPEAYRTYEALEAGALPIVDSDYYEVRTCLDETIERCLIQL